MMDGYVSAYRFYNITTTYSEILDKKVEVKSATSAITHWQGSDDLIKIEQISKIE
jgi:hypothetical protein